MTQQLPGHWFSNMEPTWPLRLRSRVRCTCGWVSRPYWNLDKAANDLILHQAISLGVEQEEGS